MQDDKEREVRTNLSMPEAMRERIIPQAKIDRRSFKAEILVLLDEALTARERKK